MLVAPPDGASWCDEVNPCLMKAGAQAILCLARSFREILLVLNCFNQKLIILMPDVLSSHQIELDIIQCFALA